MRPRLFAFCSRLCGVGAGALLLPAPRAPAQGRRPRRRRSRAACSTCAQREDTPQGFAIHETSTVSTTWPAMPCFNNLVLFDPLKQRESVDTVIGELAEKWSWQDNYRNLVFFLRRNVKWHDGQPFTSKDVKFTFDMLREAPDAAGKLRINPRKDWYVNVQNVEAPDPYTVIFHLKRPQPALLLMMAPPATRRSTPPTCRPRSTAPRAWGRDRTRSRSGARASSSST